MNHLSKFEDVVASLKSIDDEIKQVEKILEEHCAPYTPGRFPEWRRD
jgi:hypothetical protein